MDPSSPDYPGDANAPGTLTTHAAGTKRCVNSDAVAIEDYDVDNSRDVMYGAVSGGASGLSGSIPIAKPERKLKAADASLFVGPDTLDTTVHAML